ncbi:hypothetical protein A2U01_0067882, partial [Trifolium medium]|nr:hypothetical protein [Trifolium medium]
MPKDQSKSSEPYEVPAIQGESFRSILMRDKALADDNLTKETTSEVGGKVKKR